ncbi:amidohydrolase family protein [Ruegeria hyattellae]|uniref:amidohydrolase family protein n=1 Tax=Ruegeria hyattellae TaxID=3233337 RepID=UPI00355BEF58
MNDIIAPLECDTLVIGCDVVTLDGKKTVLPDGAIAIKDKRIAWIGPAAETRKHVQASDVLDAGGQIAMPGMIDGHFHTAQQLLRGKLRAMVRDAPLKIPYWKNYLIPFESLLSPEDVHLSGLIAYTNMISVGTTCFAEAGGPHPDEMGRAALETGIRGLISKSTIDKSTSIGSSVPDNMMMASDDALAANVALVERWRKQDQDRVKACLSLRQIIVCSQGLLQDMSGAAQELDVKIHTHLCEGTYEIDYALEHHGCRPVEYLESLGILDHHLHCAHSVLLSPNEVDLYEKRRPSACHCAFNNYAMGAPRVMEMWRRGIDIGLGTDGASTFGTLDIFRVAHATLIGQQAVSGTPWHMREAMLANETLEMATCGGARSLGLQDQIGSLEVGKRADILLARQDRIDQLPSYDPLFTAANNVVGQDVQTVIIDGTTVMKDREILTVDVDRLKHELTERLPGIMTRFERMVA